MVTVKEKIAAELSKAKTIWKELVSNRQPDVKKFSDIYRRYKLFLEDNKNFFMGGKPGYFKKEVDMVETLLKQYHEVTAERDKKFLLNDVYVGLIFGVSESIEDLESRMEEEALTSSKQMVLN